MAKKYTPQGKLKKLFKKQQRNLTSRNTEKYIRQTPELNCYEENEIYKQSLDDNRVKFNSVISRRPFKNQSEVQQQKDKP